MLDSLSLGILGVVQGFTEFLPVSSTGHLILARVAFGFSTEFGLAIDAILQLATALAVVAYYWRDLTALTQRDMRPTLVAIVAGTVPAVVAGLFLENIMETVFRSATLVAYALIAGSVVMLLAEYAPKPVPLPQGWRRGLFVGLFQTLALIPGMSRSGMTIAGGMIAGLGRPDAARFSFLLAAPILLGSGLKKLFELISLGITDTLGIPLLIGGLAAFFSGLVAIHLLIILVRKTPLTVFVVYRIALAVIVLVLAS